MLDFPRWKKILVLSVCLLFALWASPNILSEKFQDSLPEWFPSRTLNLGLDLQGGSHLLLQVDFDYFIREEYQNLADEVRAQLREEKFRYKRLNAQAASVTFESESDSNDIENAIAAIDPLLSFTNKEEGKFGVSYSDQQLTEKQIRQLFLDLDRCDDPSHCPHGRPTWIRWTQKELEKAFSRIV